MLVIQSINGSVRRVSHPVVLVLLFWLILAAPWLFGLKVIPYDSAHQFYPAVAFTVEQLRSLEGPWWNPYVFGGFPQFADPQAMPFQPTMILPMLLSPDTSLWWFNVVVLLHLLLGGLGCLRLGKSYGFGTAAQLLFALTFMFGAVASSRLQHTPMIVTYSFIPWAWLLLRCVLERPAWVRAVACGAVFGLCALQLTQVTYLFGLLAGAYAAGGVISHRDGKEKKRVACLFLAGLVCLLVCSPQLASTLAVLPETNRVAVAVEASLANSLRLEDFSTLLAANALSHLRGAYWGRGEMTQTYAYVGFIPLLLCLVWGGSRGKWGTQVRWAWCVIVGGVIFSLGARTPVYPSLHEYLPGLGMFRRPSDALFFVNGAVAFLSAISLQRRLEGSGARPAIIPCLLFATVLVVAALAAFQGGHLLDFLTALGVTAALSLMVILLLRGTRLISSGVLALLVGAVALDFAVNQSANRLNSVDDGVYMTGTVASADRSSSGQFAGLLSQRIDVAGAPERVEILGAWPISNGGILQRLPMSTGYNPMIYRRYSEMFGIGPDPLASPAQRRFTEWAPDYSAPAFDLLGVRGLAVGPVMPGQGASFQYVERKTVLPRVLVPHQVLRHEAAYPPALEFSSTDFHSAVWLPEAVRSECSDAGMGNASARVAWFTPQAITIDYEAPGPTWVVLNEMYGEGWQAMAGDRTLPVVRANGIFRAVCVPAGSGQLRLAYSPWAMILSAWRS